MPHYNQRREGIYKSDVFYAKLTTIGRILTLHLMPFRFIQKFNISGINYTLQNVFECRCQSHHKYADKQARMHYYLYAKLYTANQVVVVYIRHNFSDSSLLKLFLKKSLKLTQKEVILTILKVFTYNIGQNLCTKF